MNSQLHSYNQILLVDDEPAIRAILRNALETDGFAVLEAGDKRALFRSLVTNPIRLITLDLGQGSEDVLALAREIRAKRNVPIVVITGRSAPIDRVAGLEHGVDEYISKPFRVRDVVMRIRSVVRRYRLQVGGSSDGAAADTGAIERYAFDAGILDVANGELRAVDGTVVDLTETEFRLLAMLLQHPARILARDEFSQDLWGQDCSPPERVIDRHIARLRKKIEPPSEAPSLIKSVRGVGYVFTGAVGPA